VPGCLDKRSPISCCLRVAQMQSAGQIRCIGGKELQPEEFVLQAHELPTGAAAMDGQSVPRGSAKNAPQQMRKKLDDPRPHVTPGRNRK
jgi:hypothetical protein